MKTNLQIYFICLSVWFVSTTWAFADTLFLSNGHTISGTMLQTNDDDILLLTDYAAFNFSKSNIKEIKIEPAATAQLFNTDRIPDFKKVVLLLSKEPWATNLTPIPATVIDKGILRNVPYSSFRCGKDYEVNVYGDLDHPAGFEIGVYHRLLESKSAQVNCIKFISDLLSQSADKKIVQELDLRKDLKIHDDLTFEITPPTADDAYGGWWVSVYSEQQLNLARASVKEMEHISVSKADVAKQSTQTDNPSSAWSADEMRLARPSAPQTFTFTDKSGEVITNAQVVRIYEKGVSLIWRSGSSMGMVKLADLPEDLRIRFGYDAVKAAEADQTEKEKRAQWQKEVAAAQAAQQSTAQYPSKVPQVFFTSRDYSSGYGSVYVHGYYRRNGTYVHGYWRSR